MAIPAISNLIRYINRKLTGSNWNTNLQKIVNWFSDGTTDFNINSLTTANDITVGGDVTVTGDVTADEFIGDGQKITGLDTYRKNFIINGNTTIKNNADYTLVKDVYGESVDRFEGMATGTLVSAGTLTQTTSANAGRGGYGILFDNVTLTGTGELYLRHRIYSKSAINFKDVIGSFNMQVYHNVGSSVGYTITINKATVLNDFSSVTEISNSGSLGVLSGLATQLKFETISMGDCTNGIEILIKVECSAITLKDFQFTELQLELGDKVTNFEYKLVEEDVAHNDIDDDTNSFLVPPGIILPYAAETAPKGFLNCDGSAISRTIYADLFAIIGETHGQGDNSTTFNIPDYQGRFLRGWDNSTGRDPDAAGRTAMGTGGETGDNVGSVQSEQLDAHTHSPGSLGTDNPGDHTHNVARRSGFDNSGYFLESGDVTTLVYDQPTDGNGAHTHSVTTGITSSTGGNETRPINAYVNYIIKY